MRFKLDENLPEAAAGPLRRGGYDVASALGQGLGGAPDREIASVCQAEDRVLITLDTDFSDIRAYPPATFPGLVVLRLRRQDKLHVLEVVERLVPMFATEPLLNRLWVVGETYVRIRD